MITKLITGKKLPRLICIDGMTKEQYRSLQAGDKVEIDDFVAEKLAQAGIIEHIESGEKEMDE